MSAVPVERRRDRPPARRLGPGARTLLIPACACVALVVGFFALGRLMGPGDAAGPQAAASVRIESVAAAIPAGLGSVPAIALGQEAPPPAGPHLVLAHVASPLSPSIVTARAPIPAPILAPASGTSPSIPVAAPQSAVAPVPPSGQSISTGGAGARAGAHPASRSSAEPSFDNSG